MTGTSGPIHRISTQFWRLRGTRFGSIPGPSFQHPTVRSRHGGSADTAASVAGPGTGAGYVQTVVRGTPGWLPGRLPESRSISTRYHLPVSETGSLRPIDSSACIHRRPCSPAPPHRSLQGSHRDRAPGMCSSLYPAIQGGKNGGTVKRGRKRSSPAATRWRRFSTWSGAGPAGEFPGRPRQRGRAPTNPATWSNRSATSAYDGDRKRIRGSSDPWV